MTAKRMEEALEAGGTLHVDDFSVGSAVAGYANGEGFLPTWVVRGALAAHYGSETMGDVLSVLARVSNKDEAATALLAAARLDVTAWNMTRDVRHPLRALLRTLSESA